MEVQVIHDKEYVYCQKHDIWYPKKLYDETQTKREERKRGCAPDTSLDILSCPLCIRDLMNVLSKAEERYF